MTESYASERRELEDRAMTKQPSEILGNKYKDRISEFTGMATEASYFDDGTVTVKLEAVTAEDGARRIEWFGEHRLEKIPKRTKTGF